MSILHALRLIWDLYSLVDTSFFFQGSPADSPPVAHLSRINMPSITETLKNCKHDGGSCQRKSGEGARYLCEYEYAI